jgi:hypothetical protein
MFTILKVGSFMVYGFTCFGLRVLILSFWVEGFEG